MFEAGVPVKRAGYQPGANCTSQDIHGLRVSCQKYYLYSLIPDKWQAFGSVQSVHCIIIQFLSNHSKGNLSSPYLFPASFWGIDLQDKQIKGRTKET